MEGDSINHKEMGIMTASRDFEPLLENDDNDLSWVETGNCKGYFFSTPPVDINAPIETVWKLVKDVDHYRLFSGGTIKAYVDGLLLAGKTITLKLKDIPRSDETITVVDDEQKILGWERNFCNKVRTERYHILEPLSENQTRSYIALKIPAGFIGFFSNFLYKKTITQAFKNLNEGIKKEAELSPSARQTL